MYFDSSNGELWYIKIATLNSKSNLKMKMKYKFSFFYLHIPLLILNDSLVHVILKNVFLVLL